MRPTIRERLRWWKWFLIDDPIGRGWWWRLDQRSRDLLSERHEAQEPWPRVRNDQWVWK